ncbi:hypothetical protein [Novosphingobium mathurense]|uniref:hypothetical protein n=1 Tax=Novosphingobium mathurense TaxID=428990 RepID=UPI001C37894A|nr:hypothetical protein [Novosphingobium mathurense]
MSEVRENQKKYKRLVPLRSCAFKMNGWQLTGQKSLMVSGSSAGGYCPQAQRKQVRNQR